MQAPEANLYLDVGSDESIQFQFKTGGVADDITGFSYTMEVRECSGSTVLLTLSSATTGIVLTTPLSGIITVTFSDADTILLGSGNYKFDIFQDTGSLKENMVRGSLILKERITQI